MTFEGILPQLLGPLGLLVATLIVLLLKFRNVWYTGSEFRREVRRGDRLEERLNRMTLAALKMGGANSALLEIVRDGHIPSESLEENRSEL